MGLTSYLLGRAGDCCFMLVQNWSKVETHRQELASASEVDIEIESEILAVVGERYRSADLDLLPAKIDTFEQMLLASLHCYERAWQLDPQQDNLPRRIGNVHNELGVLYMHQAAGTSKLFYRFSTSGCLIALTVIGLSRQNSENL